MFTQNVCLRTVLIHQFICNCEFYTFSWPKYNLIYLIKKSNRIQLSVLGFNNIEVIIHTDYYLECNIVKRNYLFMKRFCHLPLLYMELYLISPLHTRAKWKTQSLHLNEDSMVWLVKAGHFHVLETIFVMRRFHNLLMQAGQFHSQITSPYKSFKWKSSKKDKRVKIRCRKKELREGAFYQFFGNDLLL